MVRGKFIENLNTYIWDDTIRQYKLIASETKNYRWNRTTREYEEVN